jgi:hypothetical protein
MGAPCGMQERPQNPLTCSKHSTCSMPRMYGTPCFDPEMAIEGDPKSPIWVISLNPKTKPTQHELHGRNPITWLARDTNPTARHFQRLRAVLGEKWYACLLKEGGIAHTDLVKCGSPGFSEIEKEAVTHCRDFLISQIRRYRPKLLLILSSDASRFVAEQAQFESDRTEGQWRIDKSKRQRCYAVLSGYASPRQEHFAKLRLRRDFLAACNRLGLKPPNNTVERDARNSSARPSP